jgi:hypothetical protein
MSEESIFEIGDIVGFRIFFGNSTAKIIEIHNKRYIVRLRESGETHVVFENEIFLKSFTRKVLVEKTNNFRGKDIFKLDKNGVWI